MPKNKHILPEMDTNHDGFILSDDVMKKICKYANEQKLMAGRYSRTSTIDGKEIGHGIIVTDEANGQKGVYVIYRQKGEDKNPEITGGVYGKIKYVQKISGEKEKGKVFVLKTQKEKNNEDKYGKFNFDDAQKEFDFLKILGRTRGNLWQRKSKEGPKKFEFISEYVHGITVDELYNYIKENPSREKDILAKKCILAYAYALKELHDKGISHGDAHTKNILIANDNSEFKARFIDFGRSKTLYRYNKIRVVGSYYDTHAKEPHTYCIHKDDWLHYNYAITRDQIRGEYIKNWYFLFLKVGDEITLENNPKKLNAMLTRLGQNNIANEEDLLKYSEKIRTFLEFFKERDRQELEDLCRRIENAKVANIDEVISDLEDKRNKYIVGILGGLMGGLIALVPRQISFSGCLIGI